MSVLIKMATWDPRADSEQLKGNIMAFDFCRWGWPQFSPVLIFVFFPPVSVLARVHCSPHWYTHRLPSIELSWEQVWSHDPKSAPQSWSGMEGWGGREEVSDQSFGGTQSSDMLPWKQAGEDRERKREKKMLENDWRRHMCPALYLYLFPPWRQVHDTVIFHFSFPRGFFPPLWTTLLMFLNLNIIKASRMERR